MAEQTEKVEFVVTQSDERGSSWLGGGFGVIFKIYGHETGGLLAVVEHPVSPRVLITPHVHEREDEYSYVLEGTIGARIGGRDLEAPAGSYILKPRGIPHAFWNPTDKPARILEMISPAGFEKYFEEIGELIRAFDDQSAQVLPEERVQRLTRLADRFGLRYLPEWVPEIERKHRVHGPGIRASSTAASTG
jgi:quercetin dioxygenase-like cupin family protein